MTAQDTTNILLLCLIVMIGSVPIVFGASMLYTNARTALDERRERRKMNPAGLVLAGTFVGSCGHTIGIPATFPPTIVCPACGTEHVRLVAELPPPQPVTVDLAELLSRLPTVPAEEAPAVNIPQIPPREVFPTIGEDDDGEPDDVAPATEFREMSDDDLVAPDIVDVSGDV